MSDKNFKAPEKENLMTLTLEDDSIIVLRPIVVMEYCGKEYLALTPDGDESDDVYFYEFKEVAENDIELLNIDDENTLEAVLDMFDEWFDAQLEEEKNK